jgi:hypothetical protein
LSLGRSLDEKPALPYKAGAVWEATMAHISYISGNKLKGLIGGADLSGHQAWISSDREICLGRKVGEPDYVIDFGSEKLIPVKEEAGPVSNPLEVAGRRSGEFRLKILGREFLLGNLKGVVKTALLQFHSRDDAFLKRMKEVCPRTKRIVSDDKHDLFSDQRLSRKYAEPLIDGWWYGANNSEAEVRAWLQRMCELQNVRWGQDVAMDRIA